MSASTRDVADLQREVAFSQRSERRTTELHLEGRRLPAVPAAFATRAQDVAAASIHPRWVMTVATAGRTIPLW
jgi:hypothetical protein